MPRTGETPLERLINSYPLLETAGAEYVEKRGIPVAIAQAVEVRFDPDWNGRPAIIAPMYDQNRSLCSIHGRYLQVSNKQNKMFTIGASGGMIITGEGIRTDPIFIVEGLFDALSLSVCGYSSLATVGRKVEWLPEVCAGRKVILAFDNNYPGESEVSFYRQYLSSANIYRITPPEQAKDWNTALVKKGRVTVEQWLCRQLSSLKNNAPSS
jgi:Toprim-like